MNLCYIFRLIGLVLLVLQCGAYSVSEFGVVGCG